MNEEELLDNMEEFHKAMQWMVGSKTLLALPLKTEKEGDKLVDMYPTQDTPLVLEPVDIVASIMKGILKVIDVRMARNQCSCCKGEIMEVLCEINGNSDVPTPGDAELLHVMVKDPSVPSKTKVESTTQDKQLH